MTQTEKLEKQITKIIKREFMLITPQDMSKLILKVCKESGLKFVTSYTPGTAKELPLRDTYEEIEL